MTTCEDQDRVYDVLSKALNLLESPWPREPRWFEFAARKRDKYIQKVLRDAGLPKLTPEGRIDYWFSYPQGFEDAGGAWSRKWCCALGLEFIDPHSDRIHPRRDQPKEQS